MKTTTEEKIQIMQAYLNGKLIESRDNICGDNKWYSCEVPEWDWGMYDYRIKQAPKLVPLDPSPNLVGMVVRAKDNPNWTRLICECRKDRYTGEWRIGLGCNGNQYTPQNLCDNYEFLDGSPCGKMVEE